MRKVWISKEALIPKPFYKRKLFMFFVLLLLSSIMFLAYQLYFVGQLATATEMLITENQANQVHNSKLVNKKLVEVNSKREIVKGTRIRDIDSYSRVYADQKFKCLDKSKEIDWEKLNDDFCDCLDGSDETFTNACANGKFYCTKQLRHKTGRGQDVWAPTSRINDGICDCKLDCSDEFKRR
jgi:alpha-glucosidase